MKNTDEARKVMKKGDKMFWAIWERIPSPKVSSIRHLIQLIK